MRHAPFPVLLAVVFSLLAAPLATAAEPYPDRPDEALTPGSLCSEPGRIRYREKIPVCDRSVDVPTKENIVKMYDALGYRVGAIGRHHFKIDHYIPLCMGGSNEVDNLWPQHLTIFALTDALEAACCDKMADGRLTQSRAIEYIREGKAEPELAPVLVREVESL